MTRGAAALEDDLPADDIVGGHPPGPGKIAEVADELADAGGTSLDRRPDCNYTSHSHEGKKGQKTLTAGRGFIFYGGTYGQ
jgi:hypothetical protein